MAAQAQAVKPTTEITQQESLQLTRNLLRIAVFNISYIRGLFPDKYFQDTYVSGLEMKVKRLLPIDVESRRLIDWMEKGAYDALQKKYLRMLLFGLCSGEDGPLIEEYEFSFSYPKESPEAVHMSINRTGDQSHAKAFKSGTMKKSICRMVRTLVELMRTLDNVPSERTIIMKLVYYDDITPDDYEPPFFRCCTTEDKMTWLKPPLKMKAGDVNSRYYTVALKVKSTLDPCEDENDKDCEELSLSNTSHASDYSTESEDNAPQENADASVHANDDNADIGNQATRMQIDNEDSQETHDPGAEAANFDRLKQWLLSRSSDKIEMCDIMSHFPDISLTQIEEIILRLVQDEVLKVIRKDVYQILKNKKQTVAKETQAGKPTNMQTSDDADSRASAAVKRGSCVERENGSTLGLLRTTGSDVTRYGQTGSTSVGVCSKSKRPLSPSMSRTDMCQPALSRESTVLPKVRPNGCWKQSQDAIDLDHLQKASMVQKPIYQALKRIRSN